MLWNHLLCWNRDTSALLIQTKTIAKENIIINSYLTFSRASFRSQHICTICGLAGLLTSRRYTPVWFESNITRCDKNWVHNFSNVSYFSGVMRYCDIVWIQECAKLWCDFAAFNVKCVSSDFNVAMLRSIDGEETAVSVVNTGDDEF